MAIFSSTVKTCLALLSGLMALSFLMFAALFPKNVPWQQQEPKVLPLTRNGCGCTPGMENCRMTSLNDVFFSFQSLVKCGVVQNITAYVSLETDELFSGLAKLAGMRKMQPRMGRSVDVWMKSHCPDGSLPDVVVFNFNLDFNANFSPQEEDQWNRLRKKTVILSWFDDLHAHDSVTEWRMKTSMRRSTELLGTYAYLFRSWYPRQAVATKNITWLPHSASNSFVQFSHPNVSAVNSMLVSGNLEAKFYPCRKDAAVKADGISSQVLPHPDPHYSKGRGNDYPSHLRRYRFAVATNSFGYVFGKCFEIPATGAAVIIDKKTAPILKVLGFMEGEHYFSFDCNMPEGFQETRGYSNLHKVLKHLMRTNMAEKVETVRSQGMQLVKNYHTTSHRVVQFLYRIADHMRDKGKEIPSKIHGIHSLGKCFEHPNSKDLRYPWYFQRDPSI